MVKVVCISEGCEELFFKKKNDKYCKACKRFLALKNLKEAPNCVNNFVSVFKYGIFYNEYDDEINKMLFQKQS